MPSCKKEHRSGNINNYVCFLISNLTFHAIATLPGMTLHQAILEEDTNKIIHLLDSGHSADSLDKEGWSPLMLAAASEQMDVFELLLDHGARDQHVEPVTKQSVLMQVASSGHLKIVERLLKVGANPNLDFPAAGSWSIDRSSGPKPKDSSYPCCRQWSQIICRKAVGAGCLG